MEERVSVGTWRFPVVQGDICLWHLYGVERLCVVDEVGPNYLTLRDLKKPKETRWRVYEEEVFKHLVKLSEGI